jgi:hypothetical protein
MSDASGIRRELEREMGHSEKLLWSGRPVQGLKLQRSDLYTVPFSLLWAGFAVFWTASVYRSGAPPFFALFGALFVLIGLYLVVGRFFYDAWQRARTYYGLSNKRVLIVHKSGNRRITSLALASLDEINFTESTGGGGSLQFGRDSLYGSKMLGTSWPGTSRHMAPRFELADDARRVYDLILRAKSDGS